jgi:hypothetical protein
VVSLVFSFSCFVPVLFVFMIFMSAFVFVLTCWFFSLGWVLLFLFLGS